MSRGIDPATIAALATNDFEFATLIQMDFSSVVRITDWDHDITALSTTWTSSGELMSIDNVEESAEIRVNEFDLTFSGVSQSYISIMLNAEYINTSVKIWKAVLQDGAVVGQPIEIFLGYITSMSFSESDTDSTVKMSLASHWKDFEKTSGRKTNPASQQRFFPNDKGMEFTKDLSRDIPWGRK
jgi:hypothetical protein